MNFTTANSTDTDEYTIAGKKFFKKPVANTYEFYLSGYIEEPQEYVDWFDIIRNATANDLVKIYINSSGGAVDTALQFMRVLSETEAEVTVVLKVVV